MRTVDAYRPISAWRILEIWGESRQYSQDPLVRALYANATVISQCALCQGEAVYQDAMDVLEELTTQEISQELARLDWALSQVQEPAFAQDEGDNPHFDTGRYQHLREG